MLRDQRGVDMNNDQIMKLCQRGFGNYNGALDDANNLLAECYGTIGRLVGALEYVREVLNDADVNCFGENGNGEIEWSLRDEVIDNLTRNIIGND